MAIFPALEPIGRRYNLGAHPVTVQAYPAADVRFLHGNTATGATMELIYTDLSQAEAALIRSHYRGQQGSLLPFDLSPEALNGNDGSMFPVLGQWRYTSAPQESQRDAGLVDVTVQLALSLS